MVETVLHGGAGVNVLARQAGARVVVADLGVATPLSARAGLVSRRVADGTRNIARGPAMTREQAVAAIEVGAELAEAVIADGADLLGLGEMGIGNTDRKSTRLNSSHSQTSYAVFCLKKKKRQPPFAPSTVPIYTTTLSYTA